MSASHFGLGNLVAVVDNNQLGIDGFTRDTMASEPICERFAAFGWDTQRVDGHDLEALLAAYAALPATDHDRPLLIVADTVKGRGVRQMESNPNWHVGNLVGEDYDEVMAELADGLRSPEAGA